MKKVNLLRTLAFSSLLLVGCNGTHPGTTSSTNYPEVPLDSISSTITVPESYKKDEGLIRYSESWRSVKSEGWGILKSVESNPAKLDAALKLFDYMYSDAGNELMSYGPKEYGYIETDAEGNTVTIDYMGKQVPKLSEGTLAQLADKSIGANNYTNYYRYFVGATLPIGYVKEQGMEYQCTHEGGKEGLEKINKNIELETLRHPQVGNAESGNNGESVDVEPLKTNVTLNLSILYKEKESEPKFVNGGKAQNGYTDPKGNKYVTDDWKPTWKALQERLNMTFQNSIQGKDVAENFTKYVANGFSGIDIITGKSSSIVEQGPEKFLDLSKYLGRMPNFTRFLSNNPIVKRSIVSFDNNNNDAIYYAPYFDGFDDIERMTLLREDWLVKLLDNDAATFDTATTLTTYYQPTIEKKDYSLTVAASLDNKETKVVEKKQSKGNIIEIQNALEVKNGETLTKALKDYIKETYGETYSKPSDLFNGVDAAYDADEFIALLRCIKTNPRLLGVPEGKEAIPFYPRANSNDRVSDIYRWAAQMWGVQGVESRSGFLFVKNEEGRTISDARSQVKTGQMLEKLNSVYNEGLILPNFEDATAAGGQSGNYNTDLGLNNMGFATYDYCQTQTALNFNNYANGEYRLTPVITPFTNWEDLQYILVPTTFKLTTEQSTRINGFQELKAVTVEKGTQNLWTKYVFAGFGNVYRNETLLASPEALAQYMKEKNIEVLENYYTQAYGFMY